jgi:hypothetical protein
VSRKSQTFFLNAAREAAIKISQCIMKNKKPRAAVAKKRAPKAKNNTQNDAANNGGNDETILHNQKKANPSEILLMLFDPTMKQAEQDAIWTLIKFYKAKGT